MNFTLMPYIKWSPSTDIFARLGFEAGSIVYNHIKHIEELMQNSATLSTGEIVQIEFANFNGNVATVEDGQFLGLKQFQLYFVPAFGFNIELAKNVNLSPVIDCGIPLTSLTTRGDGFKVLNWRILFELRVILQQRNSRS